MGDCHVSKYSCSAGRFRYYTEKMAEILHCSQQVYSNYELGQRDIPTDILIKLADFYHVSTDFLLGLTNNPKRAE